MRRKFPWDEGDFAPSTPHSQTLESLVGLPEDFAPEELGLPVNMKLLRAYVNQDSALSHLACHEIRGYLAHCRSWRKALKKILLHAQR